MLDLFHSRFIVFTGFLQDVLDLCHCNYREEFREQEVTGKEQTECTYIETDLIDSRTVIRTPATRQVVAVHRSYDDHETLEPHTDIHQDTHEEGNEEVT